MKILKIMMSLVLITMLSCKSRTERWLNGLADFKEIKDKVLTIQALKVKDQKDTTTLNYMVRIYPANKQYYDQSLNFYYRMDSCFTLRMNGLENLPVIVQPVNNGIANCYEYLLSFDVNPTVKYKAIRLVYKNWYADGKQYELKLNN